MASAPSMSETTIELCQNSSGFARSSFCCFLWAMACGRFLIPLLCLTELVFPYLQVTLECVNACKLSRGDGSGKYDCNVLSCAWKAPRVLTGFLASTTHSPHSSSSSYGRNGRRNLYNFRCNPVSIVGSYSDEALDIILPGGLISRSVLSQAALRSWRFYCLSSSSVETSREVSPERLWEDLKPVISYLSPKELELVHNALVLAFEAHEGQKRRSGEPFIIHPVEVARILGKLELDWESLAAGLLHDTVEDTNVVTFERIEDEFGATVRHIVEGETKVSKLGKLKFKNEHDSVQDVKADDLRQMFLAMTEEVRVIIVKLADRLHNMRTLSHMPPHKQTSIAMETLQVFAPLAKLLGMYQIKSELENLSFMYTNAEDYAKVKRRAADLYKEHEKELLEANEILVKKIQDDQFLDLLAVKTEVLAVCKEPYSIYKAVLKSKGSINEINQIAQLRVIIKPKACIGDGPLCSPQQICYHVLGLIHGIWTPIPRSVKDYIATSKPNGYQSLHTTVIPFLYERMLQLEVQIRTEEMDLIAERGIAAHYSGREFVSSLVGSAMPSSKSSRGKAVCLNNANFTLRIGWLNAIREWQEEFVGNMSSREFVDTITRDLLGSRVFVFTPRGEIKNLPRGATVIDYAYMIHTEIGNKMVAAKVNGNLISPTHILANAEVVEIITYDALSSKSAFQRHKEWLQHAKTRSARHKIMKFLKEQAVLSAADMTTEAVSDFVAESVGDSESVDFLDGFNSIKPKMEKTFMNGVERSSMGGRKDVVQSKNGSVWTPKVNGKHNKHVSLKGDGGLLLQGNHVTQTIQGKLPGYKDVLPGLESWQAQKIASWHNIEGHSIQWFRVVCIDRRGMMAEITTALATAGITLCSCVAEIDGGRVLAVMLFQIEGKLENLSRPNTGCFGMVYRLQLAKLDGKLPSSITGSRSKRRKANSMTTKIWIAVPDLDGRSESELSEAPSLLSEAEIFGLPCSSSLPPFTTLTLWGSSISSAGQTAASLESREVLSVASVLFSLFSKATSSSSSSSVSVVAFSNCPSLTPMDFG
ncbi:putative GTP diphosphokinase RSH1, chloroplastic isoform X1 [Senna tora]|uniref:Putative GTP diphosphokinase RSH1, chloroplastic n=1 Tax=Senna tora TaxID=362788 RepID=A0A834SI85_9FABA|nr:putative GTP diphosphokinase RSH1, chloroplastic isoform X1 [Senna tora]